MQTIKQKRHAHGVRPQLRLNPIAAACTLMLLVTGNASAQQTPTTTSDAPQAAPQSVVITGIRRSLEDSLAVKRNSDDIVEVVSAEDTGKLPDNSIAEALARLPGVTGQRGPDGRVNVISIRGLSPEFSGALLNGREMVSSSGSRTVEYDQFPSELISSAVVYKTPDATLIGQGLSGTVDLHTRRPLDTRGTEFNINVRGDRNSNGELIPGVTPALGSRLSFSYVDQFANNTIGVAIGFARLDTASELKRRALDVEGDYVSAGVPITGIPPELHPVGGATNALLPMFWEAQENSTRNTRDGLMGVFEYKPNRDWHSVVDLYYSKFDTHDVGALFRESMFNAWDGASHNVSNVGTTQVGQNTYATTGTANDASIAVGNTNDQRTDKTTAIGWNNELKLANKWTAVSDLSYSHIVHDEAYSEVYGAPYNNATNSWLPAALTWNVPTNSGNSTFTPVQSNFLNNISLGDPQGYVPTQPRYTGTIRSPSYDDELKTLRLSAKHEMDGPFKSFVGGFNYTERDKIVTNDEHRLLLNTDSSGNDIRTIPAGALGTPYNMGFAGVNSIASINVPALIALGAVTPQALFSQKPASESGVHEKVSTLFGKFDIDTNLGSVPVRGNVGVQAVHTQQSSTGWEYRGNDVTPDISLLFPRSGGASYNDFLPSLNLIADLPNDWVARFGLAKTLARPNIVDMRAGTSTPTVNTTAGPTQGQWAPAYGGNPEIQPWRANSIDLEFEKYFSKRSYISAAVFYKDLLNYVYQETVSRDNSFLPVANLPAGVVPQRYGPYVEPANGQGGSLRGLELAAAIEGKLIHPALDGFGVIASASKLGSNVKDQNGAQIALNGLSGTSGNMTFYYEANGFSARISERYRAAFTATTTDVYLQSTTTQQVADRIMDLQLSYDFKDGTYKGLSFLFQVNNLRNNTTQNLLSSFNPVNPAILGPYQTDEYGREILLGMNYKF